MFVRSFDRRFEGPLQGFGTYVEGNKKPSWDLSTVRLFERKNSLTLSQHPIFFVYEMPDVLSGFCSRGKCYKIAVIFSFVISSSSFMPKKKLVQQLFHTIFLEVIKKTQVQSSCCHNLRDYDCHVFIRVINERAIKQSARNCFAECNLVEAL